VNSQKTEISSELAKIPEWKLKEVDELVNLFKKYKNIAVIIVSSINDRQIQQTRRILRGKAELKMSKKNLQSRAIEKYQSETKKEGLEELIESIPGQSTLLFTNMNIFEVKRLFGENKWMIPARPGAKTPVDIIVPAGDTGLPTGQVISELNMTLKLPTRIQNDTIWVREDKLTHKAGDLVTIKEAAVLKKLGVKPLESLIRIHFAWCDGEILTEDIIYMDMEQFQKDIQLAFMNAKSLALEMNIVDKDTIEPLISKGHREALALLFELPIFVDTMLDEYMMKAQNNANTLNAMIFGETVKVQPSQTEEKKKPKEEKKEEVKEEEISGIGDLF